MLCKFKLGGGTDCYSAGTNDKNETILNVKQGS